MLLLIITHEKVINLLERNVTIFNQKGITPETEVEVEPRLKTYQRRRKKGSKSGSVQMGGIGVSLGVGGENISL